MAIVGNETNIVLRMTHKARADIEQRKKWAALGHIIESQQYTEEFLDAIFERTNYYAKQLEANSDNIAVFSDRLAFSVFFEESTRTRFSFETAAHKLGMDVVGSEAAKMFSSIAKGESIEDMIRVLEGYYPDVIILRTDEEGLVPRAANTTDIPVISAGDGKGQHPTQSLLDLYTIKNELGRRGKLKVVFGGDLANGRTVRSLAYLLARYPGNSFHFISPPELSLSDDIRDFLLESGANVSESNSIGESFDDADVVYWTRTQLEKGSDDKSIKEIVLSAKDAKRLPKHAIILHPLPKVNEIEPEVDNLPQAKYFTQAKNGLPVRMALLEHVIKD